jgi:uncharacterized protein (DUF433 family)
MVAITNQHIEIIDGTAHVINTPFKVADVAAIYLHGQSSVDWIVENYPLTYAQIHAALAYYYDHQAEIERYWRETERLAHEVGTPASDVIARMRARQKPNSTG